MTAAIARTIVCAALSLTVVLLHAAEGPAGGGAETRGGTLRLGDGWGTIDLVDQPGSDIFNTTALPLVSFPDRAGDLRLLPAGAAALPEVSAGGRRYTFTIRKGLRFSDGRPVTARNYEVAFRRFFARYPRSPLFEDVVGARASTDGGVPSGVQLRNGKLVIRLVAPAEDLLVRLASGPISATPLDLPLSGVTAPLPSAGPYYVAEWVPMQSMLIVRNPYWRRDLLPWRPANVDRIVYEFVPLDEQVPLVERGELDLAFVWPKARQELAAKYGVNEGRFRVVPTHYFRYFELNNESPLFRGNPSLRRAINYALDRPELLRQLPLFAGRPTDQVLTPGMLGFHDWKLYPLSGSHLKTARALARGHLRSRKAVLWTWASGSGGPADTERLAEVVKFQLGKIGLDVEIEAFDAAVVVERRSERNARWDIAYAMAYALDPSEMLGRFDSRNIRYGLGFDMLNSSRFRDDVFDRRLREAKKLSGSARLDAYAAIDRDVMSDRAPIAPLASGTQPYLVSASTGCFTFNAVGLDLAALCKK